MRNFKITLEYDGASFCGWQSQGQGERTVQDELEGVFLKIFKKPVKAVASGRTDSGVHARGQVVSFKASTRMKALEIKRALNGHLPPDIAVHEALEVEEGFHAQYSVKEKTYRYTILNRPWRSAFLRDRALFYPYPLNMSRMRKAAGYLIGRHDFKTFQAHDPERSERRTVRTIKNIVIKRDGELIHVDMTADGFLYKMVRNIAGTLLAVGSGHLAPKEMPGILKARDRKKARDTAPAHGLCLMRVQY
ncbi:MAG: tRNA pseudouridine(38-40) synthase TruA [Candidatus Omnitrophica bacterium]|nr:tRNA pseudouridine(38-40) synthase TruA [Candidatus Omnitrophota bacterium]MDE2009382.1 tRNA pseudouridine(38-40) synthase TruA [Candidatus Omnitrophota bacterium]MDE2214166.1 tRNA pseudouridine(38-40) synthase TruA [Candidatus Omnitrophota bacterium]MDE2231203.1 tRNA pseudouridine(38-40) synthase TruA [Candidatus Omnitrophota bacterium]